MQMREPPALAGHAGPAGQPVQFLSFMLGEEVFAIGILAIREIIEYSKPTMVPMMPRCVRGVINLRGLAVPVIDLGERLGRPGMEAGQRACIVIVEVATQGGSQVVGLLVNAVNEVLDIALTDIEPAPTFGLRTQREVMAGIAKVGGKFVMLLQAEALLA